MDISNKPWNFYHSAQSEFKVYKWRSVILNMLHSTADSGHDLTSDQPSLSAGLVFYFFYFLFYLGNVHIEKKDLIPERDNTFILVGSNLLD